MVILCRVTFPTQRTDVSNRRNFVMFIDGSTAQATDEKSDEEITRLDIELVSCK